ncbi:MAG TPA: aminodeoxychorismate synthase component I [bacterium]|nr:aminodeoxychorismate synthase component I [bacterium]
MRPSNSERQPVYKGRSRVRLLDLDASPASLFAPLAARPGSIFLDSALTDRYGLGRWSFIMYDPLFTLSDRDDTIVFRIGNRLRWERINFFEALRQSLALFSVKGEPSWIPFRGGAAGYFAYELGRQTERLPAAAVDDLNLPEACLGFYDIVLAFDHLMEQWFLCHIDFGLKRPDLEARFREVKILVAKAKMGPGERAELHAGPLQSNFEPEQYLEAIARARRYIEAGDIYQANVSQRFSAVIEQGEPWQVYERLREKNAAPFAAFLQFGAFQVLSSSPERFLLARGDRVETRPIKGTRPRGESPREDAWYKAQLLASIKDRAELNMIVDLERNDLGRVCRYGTVAVTRHAQCESYARVHHLVSTVEGMLRPDCDVADLMLAAFPGGSITGAPKIRAMEIIDELEPNVRSVYTGSIGYIGFDGDLDLNIAIRTMIISGRRVCFGSGGGIVYDSDPQMEYDETYDKARALIEALGGRVGGF